MRVVGKPDEFRAKVGERIMVEGHLRQPVARNIEIGIFNYALEEAQARNIVKR